MWEQKHSGSLKSSSVTIEEELKSSDGETWAYEGASMAKEQAVKRLCHLKVAKQWEIVLKDGSDRGTGHLMKGEINCKQSHFMVVIPIESFAKVRWGGKCLREYHLSWNSTYEFRLAFFVVKSFWNSVI